MLICCTLRDCLTILLSQSIVNAWHDRTAVIECVMFEIPTVFQGR